MAAAVVVAMLVLAMQWWQLGAPSAEIELLESTTVPLLVMAVKDSSVDPCARIMSTLVG